MFPSHLRLRTLSTVTTILFLTTVAAPAAEDLTQLLETHVRNKQRVLERLGQMPQLTVAKVFEADSRESWRQILIDGPYVGRDKQDFLQAAMKKSETTDEPMHKALASLLESHRRLFDSGRNAGLMVRYAGDPAFRPFGWHMSAGAALAEMTAGNGAEVQAFQTIFETGQNTRGYVHKLECHGQAVEFIYAVTDIVYGVMLPSELHFGDDKVTADPAKVQMFYVKAGEIIALYPYVLHSGSLSVEPDRSFSILIYKKPVGPDQQTVKLPPAWQQRQDRLKIANADKFYLTLAELHTDDLKDNRGFITGPRPLRLPNWK